MDKAISVLWKILKILLLIVGIVYALMLLLGFIGACGFAFFN
ncbi:hypothetical protein [uncultured Phascolarctobacterium sp.]|nr:hypothetical protein [uncultured Phascolarctobacterium sp.]